MEPNNDTPPVTSGTEPGFLSKYGIWIALVLVVLIGFTQADKIKAMFGGTASIPAPDQGPALPSQKVAAKETPIGNDYVSGDAINKVVLGNYQPYVESIPKTAYDSFYSELHTLFGTSNVKDNEVEWYTRAFLKGMNLAMKAEYVKIFKNYIVEYLNNPVMEPHWNVQIGQFRKSGI